MLNHNWEETKNTVKTHTHFHLFRMTNTKQNEYLPLKKQKSIRFSYVLQRLKSFYTDQPHIINWFGSFVYFTHFDFFVRSTESNKRQHKLTSKFDSDHWNKYYKMEMLIYCRQGAVISISLFSSSFFFFSSARFDGLWLIETYAMREEYNHEQ